MLASVNDVTKLRSRCLHVPIQILKVIIMTRMNMETNLLTHTTEAPIWLFRNIMGHFSIRPPDITGRRFSFDAGDSSRGTAGRTAIGCFLFR